MARLPFVPRVTDRRFPAAVSLFPCLRQVTVPQRWARRHTSAQCVLAADHLSHYYCMFCSSSRIEQLNSSYCCRLRKVFADAIRRFEARDTKLEEANHESTEDASHQRGSIAAVNQLVRTHCDVWITASGKPMQRSAMRQLNAERLSTVHPEARGRYDKSERKLCSVSRWAGTHRVQ